MSNEKTEAIKADRQESEQAATQNMTADKTPVKHAKASKAAPPEFTYTVTNAGTEPSTETAGSELDAVRARVISETWAFLDSLKSIKAINDELSTSYKAEKKEA